MLISQLFTGPRQFDAAGRFFSYTECTTPDTVPGVLLYVDGQPVGLLRPGETFELDENCSRWEVYPVNPLCSGRVLIGDGRFSSGRVTAPVETAERAVSNVMRGVEHIGGAYNLSAATLFAAVGLVCAGRPVAVKSLVVAGGSFNVHMGTGGPCTVPKQTRNLSRKLRSGALSASTIQSFDAVGLSGPITGPTLDVSFYTTTAPSGIEVIRSAPIVLVPGESMWVIHTSAVTAIMATFEVEEL